MATRTPAPSPQPAPAGSSAQPAQPAQPAQQPQPGQQPQLAQLAPRPQQPIVVTVSQPGRVLTADQIQLDETFKSIAGRMGISVGPRPPGPTRVLDENTDELRYSAQVQIPDQKVTITFSSGGVRSLQITKNVVTLPKGEIGSNERVEVTEYKDAANKAIRLLGQSD